MVHVFPFLPIFPNLPLFFYLSLLPLSFYQPPSCTTTVSFLYLPATTKLVLTNPTLNELVLTVNKTQSMGFQTVQKAISPSGQLVVRKIAKLDILFCSCWWTDFIKLIEGLSPFYGWTRRILPCFVSLLERGDRTWSLSRIRNPFSCGWGGEGRGATILNHRNKPTVNPNKANQHQNSVWVLIVKLLVSFFSVSGNDWSVSTIEGDAATLARVRKRFLLLLGCLSFREKLCLLVREKGKGVNFLGFGCWRGECECGG